MSITLQCACVCVLCTNPDNRESDRSPALDVLQFTKQAWFVGGLHHVGCLMHRVCQLFEICINAFKAPRILQSKFHKGVPARGIKERFSKRGGKKQQTSGLKHEPNALGAIKKSPHLKFFNWEHRPIRACLQLTANTRVFSGLVRLESAGLLILITVSSQKYD